MIFSFIKPTVYEFMFKLHNFQNETQIFYRPTRCQMPDESVKTTNKQNHLCTKCGKQYVCKVSFDELTSLKNVNIMFLITEHVQHQITLAFCISDQSSCVIGICLVVQTLRFILKAMNKIKS